MKFLIRTIFLFFIGVQCACEKIVDPGAPTMEISVQQVFSSDANALAYVSNMYTELNFMVSSYTSQPMSLYSDELLLTNANSSLLEYNQGAVLVENPINLNAWKGYYSTIYYANVWLEQVEQANGISASTKRQLTGEVLFLRAWCYYYLVQLYNKVPLVLGSSVKETASIANDDLPAIEKQIFADLERSEQLLEEDYPSAERARVNKFATKALAARVSLSFGQWENAISQSSGVIMNQQYGLVSPEQVFKVNSMETILQFWSQSGYTQDGLAFQPEEGLIPVFVIQEGLRNKFELTDQRAIQWLGQTEVDGQMYYYPNKYRNKVDALDEDREYLVELRLAEQYLIRAEAYARVGNLQAAVADVNFIRQRAGLPEIDPLSTTETLLQIILDERQKELFTEAGSRFFDLKRFGMTEAVLASLKPLWQTYGIVLPIPFNEVQNNPNLTQNEGY